MAHRAGGLMLYAMSLLLAVSTLPDATAQRAMLHGGHGARALQQVRQNRHSSSRGGGGSSPTSTSGLSGTESQPPVTSYDWHVTFRKGAPDCFEKNILVVNGVFQPEIRVKKGHVLEVNVHNELPDDYPSLTNGGITIHWHGLSQRGTPYYDGVAYLQTCPIPPGGNFTYRFLVTDAPGTYFWHDHASGNHADGLTGPLVIEPEDGTPQLDAYDAEKTIFMFDWYHTQGDVLAMQLNRPANPAFIIPGRGMFQWVNSPQAILLNGRGYFGDCTLGPPPARPGNVNCSVTRLAVAPGIAGQPMASAANPGCGHFVWTVQPNTTYRVRVVNAGNLAALNLCFEGHNVTIIAADATPTQALEVSCLEVNSGQRYDVLLTTNAEPGNYWINAPSYGFPGMPNGYGILRYAGASGNTSLPATQPTPAGVTLPMVPPLDDRIQPRDELFNKTAAAAIKYPFPGDLTQLAPPAATRTYRVVITEPYFGNDGTNKIAMNNVAHFQQPACSALLGELHNDPNYLKQHEAPPGTNETAEVLGHETAGSTQGREIYLDKAFPVEPVAGQHVLRIEKGDVVDFIIQNTAAAAYHGDPPNIPVVRPLGGNFTEPHPMHLHGHHFWYTSGQGIWNASIPFPARPMFRDTVTIAPGGYLHLRFVADNPGTWLFHCHILWHQLLGQALIFAESTSQIPPPPAQLPSCPARCPASGAPWRPEYVWNKYRNSPYEIPLSSIAPEG